MWCGGAVDFAFAGALLACGRGTVEKSSPGWHMGARVIRGQDPSFTVSAESVCSRRWLASLPLDVFVCLPWFSKGRMA